MRKPIAPTIVKSVTKSVFIAMFCVTSDTFMFIKLNTPTNTAMIAKTFAYPKNQLILYTIDDK